MYRACPRFGRGVGLCVGSLRSVLRTSPMGCHYYPSRRVPNKPQQRVAPTFVHPHTVKKIE
jgi:hypothetical protein